MNMSEDSEIILVETVSMFRMRYAVRVPKGKAVYALDSVVMNEIPNELSQKHLDEIIVSHRTVSEEEIREIFEEDNENCINDASKYIYDLT